MRRRTPAPTAAEYRAELAAKLRAQADLARRVLREVEGGPELIAAAERGELVEPSGQVTRWALPRLTDGLHRVELLEAGHPVVVHASELPEELEGAGLAGRYVLEPDGSLTELE